LFQCQLTAVDVKTVSYPPRGRQPPLLAYVVQGRSSRGSGTERIKASLAVTSLAYVVITGPTVHYGRTTR